MQKFALVTAMFVGCAVASAQELEPAPTPNEVFRESKEIPGTYGRIKEVEDKKRIVIAIPNRPDKTYSLTDAKVAVKVAEGLAVGDKVKVIETDKKGARSVQIVRDVRKTAQQ